MAGLLTTGEVQEREMSKHPSIIEILSIKVVENSRHFTKRFKQAKISAIECDEKRLKDRRVYVNYSVVSKFGNW